MLIRLDKNNYQHIDTAIEESIEIAKKINHGVVFFEESKGWDIEIYPDSTINSIYKYYGWDE